MTKVDADVHLTNRIALGCLSQDMSFMARILNAHIRWANAQLGAGWEASGGSDALLGVIGQNPGVTQNDLALTAVLKKSAVTKLVSEMDDNGLVIREKPKSDRRYNALRLSAAGEERWADVRRRMSEQQEPLLAPLTAEERDLLFSLMGRLIDNFVDELNGQTSRLARSTPCPTGRDRYGNGALPGQHGNSFRHDRA